MGIVFALMFGTVWALRKFVFGGRYQRAQNHTVEILDRRVIQPKNSIVVLKAYNKILIVGISDKGMHPLTEITDPVTVSETEHDREERDTLPPWIFWKRGNKSQGFSRYLNHFWNRVADNSCEIKIKPASPSMTGEA